MELVGGIGFFFSTVFPQVMEVGKKIFQTVHKVCVLINVTLPV